MATLKAVQDGSFEPIEFINKSNQQLLAGLLASLMLARITETRNQLAASNLTKGGSTCC